MTERLKNILDEIRSGKRTNVYGLKLTKEDLLSKDSNGIYFLEYLINNKISLYSLSDVIKNDAEIIYILCKNEADLYVVKPDENTLFSKVNDKRVIDYILEADKLNRNIVSAVKENMEIIDLLIFANKYFYLGHISQEIINKLKFVFDENYEYMDLDLIIKRLSDLKIEYIEEENENSQVTAAYYINKNVIQIYKATDLENADLTDLVHEILHVFQASNTNRLTLELSNELTTREVLRRLNEEGLIEENYQFLNSINEYSNYGKGYEPCIRAEYLLANILPRDVIKAYQFKPEDAILLAALLNITEESEQKESKQDSLNRACDLLDSIDELVTYDESGNIKISYTDEKYKRIYDKINYYYKIENGITMEESLKADIFKYDARYSNVQYGTSEESIQAAEITFIDYIRDNGATSTVFGMDRYVLPKTYLSDEHKNPIIMFKVPLEDERVEKIEITEDLEKKYRDNYKKCKELRWGYNRD